MSAVKQADASLLSSTTMRFRKNLHFWLLGGFVLLVIWFNFVVRMPFKSTEDVWHYLAAIHELSKNFDHINDPFFSSGPKDIHYGPYLIAGATLGRAMHIPVTEVYLVLGTFTTIFIAGALYFYFRSFNIRNDNQQSLSIYFVFLCLLAWGPSQLAYSGYFSLADLLLNGAAPAN